MLMASEAFACNSPVFRFALLKWDSDQYQCIVYHRAALSANQQAVADRMKNTIAAPEYLNCYTRQIQFGGTITDQEKTVADSLPNGDIPCIAVYHPLLRFGKKPFFRGPLTSETVDKIIRSPVRSAITERLVGGDAGVWLLVLSRDAKKNQRAEAVLSASITRMQDSCVLPGSKAQARPLVKDSAASHVRGTKIPFRIAFSLMTLSPADPAEVVLVNILRSIPGCPAVDDEPVAFLLFGRGRMHVPPLVGDRIADPALLVAYRYILGMCTCIEKAQNAGEDLLLAVDWGAELAGENGPAEDMPDLISPAAYLQVVEREIGSTAPDTGSVCKIQPGGSKSVSTPHRKSRLTLYIVCVGVLIVLFVVLPLLLIRRKRN
jgi:hypothetical protein